MRTFQIMHVRQKH